MEKLFQYSGQIQEYQIKRARFGDLNVRSYEKTDIQWGSELKTTEQRNRLTMFCDNLIKKYFIG